MPFIDLTDIPDVGSKKNRKLSILMLADDQHIANVVQDHISSIRDLSCHNFLVVNPIHTELSIRFLLRRFDAILIHYSLFVLEAYFFPPKWRRYVEKFVGFKAQIIQDECRRVDAMQQSLASLGIQAVFSSLSLGVIEKVYTSESLRNVLFVSCLPGYIPENLKNLDPPLIKDRPKAIVYRGRNLSPQYGCHGQDKCIIAGQIQEIALQNNLDVDLETDEESRIYGDRWLSFLMSGRTTLGVEGGSSIFDFTGQLEKDLFDYTENFPSADFDQIWSDLFAGFEGNVVHKTITPKFFEAIATKTALVLYPGEYRGVLNPGEHYIELQRDGRNIDEVLLQINDVNYLQELVDRTHRDIFDSSFLMFHFYVKKLDLVFTKKTECMVRKRIFNILINFTEICRYALLDIKQIISVLVQRFPF